jgi:hypothetical protein
LSQDSSAFKSLNAKDSFHVADAPWLDSCDKHRNEGGEYGALSLSKTSPQKHHKPDVAAGLGMAAMQRDQRSNW